MRPTTKPAMKPSTNRRTRIDNSEFARDRQQRVAVYDDQFTGNLLGRVENIVGFFQAWRWTRPRLYLLRSAPALACLGVLFALVISALMVPQSRLIPRYKYAANSALQKNDTDHAETMFRKVLAIAPDDLDSRYGLALIAYERKDKGRAFRLMRNLASETQFGPAHYWLASQMVEKSKLKPLTTQEQTLLGFHLRQAAIHDSSNQDAHFLMAHFSYDTHLYSDAVRHFQKSLPKHAEARLMLHDAYQKQGMIQQAQDSILEAEKFYRQRAAKEPTDVKNRLLWAQCVSMRDDVGAAMKILEEGVVLQPKEVDYRKALTTLYLRRSDQLMAQSSQPGGMSYLRQAVMVTPESPEALERLLKHAIGKGHSRNSARRILHEMNTTLRPSGILNQTLARIALHENDMLMASQHFRRAWKLDPTDFQTANNLAWTLARLDPPQLDEALLIAKQAAKLSKGDESHMAVLDTHQDIVNRLTSRSTSMIAHGTDASVMH